MFQFITNLLFSMSSVEVYNIESKIWKTIASLNSIVYYPNLHVYKGNLTMFGTNSTIEVYNGETWEIASESLSKNFERGVSVKVPCH